MKTIMMLAMLILFFRGTEAQEVPVNQYGLQVVDSYELYMEFVDTAPENRLVDLEALLNDAVFDIRYATENNFTGKTMYASARAFLRAPAAAALKQAEDSLKALGYGLKIFDGYRPYAVTVAFWEYVQDPRYVADPSSGSRHNRGCAIDLTLYDLATGEELPMPTEFDDFTEKAHHDYMELPEEVIANRELLKTAMEQAGFNSLASEWWHYDFHSWRDFELMDISFEELE